MNRIRREKKAISREKSTENASPKEDNYKVLHENLSDAFVHVDMEGRIIESNDIFCRMLGYTADELKKLTYIDLTPAKWHALEQKIVDEQIIPSGHSDVYEKEYVRKDGMVIPVELRTILLHNETGSPAGMWAIIRDISGRKLTEQALKNSEQRFRQLADAMPQLVWTANPDGTVDYYNERHREFEGFSQDENGKWIWEAVLHPEDTDLTVAAWTHAIETGEIYQAEHRVKMADGRFRWHLSRAIPVRDADGKIIKWYGTATNIDETKQAEQALRVSERRLTGVLESMPDAFVSFDKELRYTYVNANAERLQSAHRKDLLGRDVREVYPDAESYKTISHYERVIREQKPATFTSYHAGFKMWVEVRAFPTPDGVSVFYKDVTSQMEARESLKASEEKYRNLFENMAEEVHFWQLVKDESGNIITWRLVDANPPTLRSWGRQNVEEIRGKTTDEIFGPGATDHFMPVVRKIMTEGVAYSYEDYFGHLDKYFRFTSVPLGEYFITTGADITALRKAHEDLRLNRESLKRAQGVGKIGNWRLDLRKDELVWSDENYNIFGVEKGTPLTYEHFLAFIHPDDRAYVDQKWKAGIEGGEYDIEHRIIAGGETKWVREKAFLEFDDNGVLIAGFGITQDITDRKNAEAELARSRKKLDMALENANIGLWELDLRTNEMTWDERTDIMFGLMPGEFSKTLDAFLKLVDEEDTDHIRKALRNTAVNNVPFETIFRIKSDSNRQKYISCKALVNRDNSGNIISLTGVNFDITDLKEGTERLISKLNEDLLRSNKELESFAFITSHDLQEPLRMVTSFTQLLAARYGDHLDETANEYIRFAVDGAKRMYDLINGLLSYSGISRKEVTFSDVDLNKVIDNVRSNLTLIISERECILENETLPVVFADYNQMILLFQNLVANGIKFSGEQPHIYVSVIPGKTHNEFLVKDEGIGIEPVYFEKIFQIFKRLNPREQYDGTGIGLAICKRIVENHNGRIWVESGPGKGSVFHFTIPRKSDGKV